MNRAVAFHPGSVRRIAKRGLFVVLAAVAGLELLYLLSANAFLSFGGVGLLFRSTNDISARFSYAWSVWPGSVHVRNLRVVFQDQNVQWSLDIERAKVGLDMPRLVHRTFHATSVRGDGVVFRMRHRVDPLLANQPAVRVVPPIPEFPGPPLYETTVPAAPISDRDYDLWTVHIENVDVGAREIWVQQFRYVGQGRARGAFYLRPARWLWVNPAELTLEQGRLSAGEYTVAAELSGRVDCVVHPYDVRIPDGREVFRQISAGVRLAGRESSAEVAELFLSRATELEVEDGGGVFRIDARTQRGRFTESSEVEFLHDELALTHPKVGRLSGRLHVLARSEAGGHGKLRVELSDGSLSPPGPTAPPIEAERMSAEATSSSVDAAAGWSLLGAALKAQARAPDLRSLNGFIAGRCVGFRRGSARVDIDAELPGRNLSEGNVEIDANLSGSELAWDDFSTRSDVRLHARADGAFVAGRGQATLSAELRNARFAAGRRAPAGWDASVPKLDVALDLKRDGAALRGRVRLDASAIQARIGSMPLRGNFRLDAANALLDLERSELRSSARARIRGLDLGTTNETVDDWWADIDFDFLNASFGDNLDVTGAFRSRFRDAVPALSVLAQEGELPAWVADVLPLHELEATGMLRRHCRLTDVRLTRASGGPLSFRGRLLGDPKEVRGALWIQMTALKPVSAGVSFASGKSDVSVAAGSDWLDERLAELRDYAGGARRRACVPKPKRCEP